MAYQPPLNGGRINASITGNTSGTPALVSNGTLVLAGGNNITLSQNANNITISGATIPSGSINFSASNTSANLASVTFANSNGLSFGLTNGVITGSYNALTSQSNQALSGSNGSFTFQTATLGNLNGLSFYSSNGSLVGSHNGLTTQSNQTVGLYAVGNTTVSSSLTQDARSLSFNGLGGVSVGYSNGSIQISAPDGTWADWTPSLTNITQGSGTITARYTTIGDTVHFYFSFTYGSGSAVGSDPRFSLPVTAISGEFAGSGFFLDSSASAIYPATVRYTTTTVLPRTGAHPSALVTSTVPFTWATSDTMRISGTYEAA